jgi:hypothetical protein
MPVDQIVKVQLELSRASLQQGGMDAVFKDFNTQLQSISKTQQASKPEMVARQLALDKAAGQAQRALGVEKLTQQASGLFGEGMGNAIGGIGELTGEIGAFAGEVTAALGPVGLVVGGIAAVGAAFVGLIATMNELAKAASPAMAAQQQRAFADLQAVIGRAFLPVLEAVTQSVRLLADVINSLIPSTGEMTTLVQGVKYFFAEIRREVDLLVRMAQLMNFQAPVGLKSSVGAAGAETAFSGFEEFSKKLSLASFAMGGVTDPAEATATNTEKLVQLMTQLVGGTLRGNPGEAATKALAHFAFG